MRLLAKSPVDRPDSAGAVALELNQILSTEREALQAAVTGPREVQATDADVTQVLDDVSDKATAPPMNAGGAGPSAGSSGAGVSPSSPSSPMMSFAGASRPQGDVVPDAREWGDSDAVAVQSAAASSPSRGGALTVIEDDEPYDDEPESRGSTTAIFLLVLFAVIGAAGGLAYLEFSQASKSEGEAEQDPVQDAASVDNPPTPEPLPEPVVAAPPVQDEDRPPSEAEDGFEPILHPGGDAPIAGNLRFGEGREEVVRIRRLVGIGRIVEVQVRIPYVGLCLVRDGRVQPLREDPVPADVRRKHHHRAGGRQPFGRDLVGVTGRPYPRWPCPASARAWYHMEREPPPTSRPARCCCSRAGLWRHRWLRPDRRPPSP